jgi:predicted Rossmann fold nucleotide-binding protein DprA/Smf involved in DNA uptake
MKKYWVWLSSLEKISPKNRLKLLDIFEDPKKIWGASEQELRKSQILTESAINQVTSEKYKIEALKHFNLSSKSSKFAKCQEIASPSLSGSVAK